MRLHAISLAGALCVLSFSPLAAQQVCCLMTSHGEAEATGLRLTSGESEASGQSANNRNLITNPGFEQGLQGWWRSPQE